MAGTPEISETARPTEPLTWPLHNRLYWVTRRGHRGRYSLLARVSQATFLTPKNSLSQKGNNAIRHEDTRGVSHKGRPLQERRVIWKQLLPTGKMVNKAVTFLLNPGCTSNLLSHRLFDTLGAHERASIESYERAHGTLADRSCIPFYGVLTLLR